MIDRIKYLMSLVFETEVGLISDDASPDNIDSWDSLRHMNLIVSIEEEFGVQFNDEEILEMMNLPLIIEVLKEKEMK